MSLAARVRNFIEQRGLLRPGDAVVVGVSGGPDSLCLLDVLCRLDWRLTVHAAHLNHGLRAEAGREAEFVRAEAAARGASFHLASVDTRAYASAHRRSVEEAARELRYDFLARVTAQTGAQTIAVAHTADDQAETVLMHFLRGSGVAGLRGMLPKSGKGEQPVIVRPLLIAARSEVEAYCTERGLQPMRDPTNADTTYFRNRLRHELLPALETYNPNIRTTLARTAEVMAGEHELVLRAVDALWDEIACAGTEAVTLHRARWRARSVPEQRALLRRAVQLLRPGLRDIDFAPLEAAVRFSRDAQTGRVCDLADGLCLAVDYESIVLREWSGVTLEAAVPQLKADGRLAEGWEFRAFPVAGWSPEESTPWRVFVDARALAQPVGLRRRRDGDRFQPLGLAGHHVKVSDFLINRKISAPLRAGWPLVVCGEAIVWVAGLRLDERFRITDATQAVVGLEFGRTPV
jgi:tRNA(Ile)-lysidine synthase